MRAQLVHLSGPHRGRTRTHDSPNVLIGADPDAQARFPPGGAVRPRHAEIAFVEDDCAFLLRRIEGQVFVNRREVSEALLEHGDMIEVGAGGPRLRFNVVVEKGRVCKPVRQMLGDAGEVARESGALSFTHSFVRDLLTHASWQLKVGGLLVVLAILFPTAYLAGWLGARRPVLSFETRQRQAGEAVARIHDVYSRGVCLIHAIYTLTIERDGSRRYLLNEVGERVEMEYTGSAFLVSSAGHLITNRHVAAPWTSDESVRGLLALGWQPEFLRLTATFPGRRPVAVDPESAELRSDDLDVALLRVDVEGVPVLPLSDAEPKTLRGQPVVVLGYPTGIDLLLAKADPQLRRRLMEGDWTVTSAIDGLAEHDAISPGITHGAVGEVLEDKIIYDADTTVGGSGGPVFGQDGEVIGVTYGIFRPFGGTNFGVPIRFARELLR